ncbi:hypothetical protein [Eremococcus coleocola]|uniref:hypothetical protein n=1 Tax=Eremococcus coleocola TaxID=88132 RepID=UPI0004845C35|nr:hypothetical protein [Eremococcus coleocola]
MTLTQRVKYKNLTFSLKPGKLIRLCIIYQLKDVASADDLEWLNHYLVNLKSIDPLCAKVFIMKWLVLPEITVRSGDQSIMMGYKIARTPKIAEVAEQVGLTPGRTQAILYQAHKELSQVMVRYIYENGLYEKEKGYPFDLTDEDGYHLYTRI